MLPGLCIALLMPLMLLPALSGCLWFAPDGTFKIQCVYWPQESLLCQCVAMFMPLMPLPGLYVALFRSLMPLPGICIIVFIPLTPFPWLCVVLFKPLMLLPGLRVVYIWLASLTSLPEVVFCTPHSPGASSRCRGGIRDL